MGKFFGYKTYDFDFFKHKKLFYIIAAAVILAGLFVWVFMGMNLGVDFTGGSIFEISYDDAQVSLEDVRDTVSQHVKQTPSVNQSGKEASFMIRTEEMDEAESAALIDSLRELGDLTVDKTERIGPVIGQELLRNALLALAIAGVLILVYISIRFRFNYALPAVLALLHDALIVCSVFVIFRIEVNSYFIAAVLTTIGYSINNTIVIFDRIRENEVYYTRRERKQLVNASINQTLGRTINTVVAVLILLFALLLFGGETTKTFVLAMAVGMFAGFYSSVFLVGNLFCDLTTRISTRFGGDRKTAASRKKRTVRLKRNLD